MDKREIERKFKKREKGFEQDARNQLTQFITQSYGLEQSKVYDLFNKHDAIWTRYARAINARSKPIAEFKDHVVTVTCSPSAFEELVMDLHTIADELTGLPKHEIEHYKRIAEMFRPTTKWEKFIKWFKTLLNK